MWTPSTALTTLATLAALVTFGGAVKEKDSDFGPYESLLHKGIIPSELDETRGPYFIANQQCRFSLGHELTCDNGWPASAVRIIAQDGKAYPEVSLHHSLQSANVVRTRPCLGSAVVSVRLACSSFPNKK